MEVEFGRKTAAGTGVVRPATEADAAALAEIDAETSSNPRTVAYHAGSCGGRGGERVLVCEQDGNLAGFVVFSAVADEGSIYTVAVRPALQARGIGRALMRGALDTMRRDGLRRCLLDVRESNRAARALYKSLGFVEDGRRRDYYRGAEGREDALLMSLGL